MYIQIECGHISIYDGYSVRMWAHDGYSDRMWAHNHL